MRRIHTFLLFFWSFIAVSQTDYSNRWEDLFSYTNVKDFVKEGNTIYAVTDNAVFIYDTQTKSTRKLSSIQGLSGETTTSIHYNKSNERLVLGYENGLIEVVDRDGKITTSPEITNFNQTGEKRVNHIYEYQNKLYISTSFAIVVYDIDNLEFGDTYFIGAGSSDEWVNEMTVFQNRIYAATRSGLYSADINNPNLIDFSNWTRQITGDFKSITSFNTQLFAGRGRDLLRINGTMSSVVRSFSQDVVALKSSPSSLSVSLNSEAFVLNTSLNTRVQVQPTTNFGFTLNQSYEENGEIYLATKTFGILKTQIASPQTFEEIHPEGPLFNDIFSIDVHNNNLWVVYGGYDAAYTPLGFRKGFSHFNGANWLNSRYTNSYPYPDLVHVTIDKTLENKAYISTMGGTTNPNSVTTGGLMEVENDVITNYFNQNNSLLEPIAGVPFTTIRISGTAFDGQGNLWVTNVGVPNKLKKLSPNGQWTSIDLNVLDLSRRNGMNEVVVDRANTVWVGTRRNGVFIYNENGNRKKSLVTEPNKGNLPNLNVRTVAVDRNNRVWLGTLTGLVVYNNALGVFDADITNAEPVIILDDGAARRLLGDQTVNSIEIDGADNKWFGTDNGGVVYTNPSGQNTLARFDKDNSPLPSNKIAKIKVDDITGKVYFATNKGMVAYNSKVAPFGEELGEVYAYPNPVLKNHETVTIDGRNGKHLPKGTNVKILDVAGNLVYETNVVEGQQLLGGRVVWNKKNLAGTKVASGIYIVLLSNEDGSETSTTKIAIVN
ncbi:hypothetical protein WH52_12775 [Tenacibaculum holothuriorum]|uniref:PorZ N-terminal beta-propeller domain-containing protein n=1 Tax=Tenacibaculum holothuriorum TaxID=1635173 RepID=A0A1Y2P9L0_9FLAO|nr:two-component regulator propeller domain-containing protein [Tenacibaculum holothuriorum]OSY87133.1 hypothetical protein WH52_12775 [Tenacibaculum holothuriorum]